MVQAARDLIISRQSNKSLNQSNIHKTARLSRMINNSSNLHKSKKQRQISSTLGIANIQLQDKSSLFAERPKEPLTNEKVKIIDPSIQNNERSPSEEKENSTDPAKINLLSELKS